ncbi:hypothetical protein CXG81DRAFT_24128 [Caulochytrium protostelioides]|uniref:Uncharacterized protein n=1 Tax=Caulochytrium protostelioides TaxID=1555241 RepID=A0A4P9XCS5_9FUNG|nr:hypothetical protein CXG81DRAFT_24128 [Caulochytrium protostelioides]|eukprot:RKP03243.1 hypothetical protein CXG81DRAFT_24128 [Caulochytrium protostelioides]
MRAVRCLVTEAGPGRVPWRPVHLCHPRSGSRGVSTLPAWLVPVVHPFSSALPENQRRSAAAGLSNRHAAPPLAGAWTALRERWRPASGPTTASPASPGSSVMPTAVPPWPLWPSRVPRAEAWVIERWGRFHRIVTERRAWRWPLIERVRCITPALPPDPPAAAAAAAPSPSREDWEAACIVAPLPPYTAATADGAAVPFRGGWVRYVVTDPFRAAYAAPTPYSTGPTARPWPHAAGPGGRAAGRSLPGKAARRGELGPLPPPPGPPVGRGLVGPPALGALNAALAASVAATAIYAVRRVVRGMRAAELAPLPLWGASASPLNLTPAAADAEDGDPLSRPAAAAAPAATAVPPVAMADRVLAHVNAHVPEQEPYDEFFHASLAPGPVVADPRDATAPSASASPAPLADGGGRFDETNETPSEPAGAHLAPAASPDGDGSDAAYPTRAVGAPPLAEDALAEAWGVRIVALYLSPPSQLPVPTMPRAPATPAGDAPPVVSALRRLAAVLQSEAPSAPTASAGDAPYAREAAALVMAYQALTSPSCSLAPPSMPSGSDRSAMRAATSLHDQRRVAVAMDIYDRTVASSLSSAPRSDPSSSSLPLSR